MRDEPVWGHAIAARDLKNKPLVEAILEVKWGSVQRATGVGIHPHYKLLLGRLYERAREDYREHEELPSAEIPDEISGHMVKHRFRRTKDGWPLIQVGPGILTVNDTSEYTWTDFRMRSIAAVSKLFESHPKPEELRINGTKARRACAPVGDNGPVSGGGPPVHACAFRRMVGCSAWGNSQLVLQAH